MIHNNFFVVLASAFFVFVNGRPTNLVAIACERDPTLSMCSALENTEISEFRAADVPEDEDTRMMRSFPKVDFDDLQVERYCTRHQDHYSHYCVGEGRVEIRLEAKLLKFCPSFEKHCPEIAKNMGSVKVNLEPFKEPSLPLIIPPPLPSASNFNNLAFDQPIESGFSQSFSFQPLNPELVKMCVPGCTASFCTTECICANTARVAFAKCNPPANSAMASVCQAWYQKCTMYKPVSY